MNSRLVGFYQANGFLFTPGLSSPVVKMGTGIERKHVVDGWYDTARLRLFFFF